MNIANPIFDRGESNKDSNLSWMFLSSAFVGGLTTFMLAFKKAVPQPKEAFLNAHQQIEDLARDIAVLKAKIDAANSLKINGNTTEEAVPLEEPENSEASVKPSKAQGMVNHLKHIKN
jgi:hypothetical protein